MLVVGSRRLDEADLFLDVALHAAAQGRIELRDVANLQTGGDSGARDARRSMLQPTEIPLCFDRGRAAGARRGDGLLVNSISHIAGNENAGVLALGEMPNKKISVRIRLQFSLERLGVWIVPD